MTEPLTTYRTRRVFSYARGQHYPEPVERDGVWRCHDCGERLRRYTTWRGEVRLRHYSARTAR